MNVFNSIEIICYILRFHWNVFPFDEWEIGENFILAVPISVKANRIFWLKSLEKCSFHRRLLSFRHSFLPVESASWSINPSTAIILTFAIIVFHTNYAHLEHFDVFGLSICHGVGSVGAVVELLIVFGFDGSPFLKFNRRLFNEPLGVLAIDTASSITRSFGMAAVAIFRVSCLWPQPRRALWLSTSFPNMCFYSICFRDCVNDYRLQPSGEGYAMTEENTKSCFFYF